MESVCGLSKSLSLVEISQVAPEIGIVNYPLLVALKKFKKVSLIQVSIQVAIRYLPPVLFN